ncbi:MAG: HNH endonuclease [Smithellaceae bacterium]|jgi:hypothetical protein
MAISRATISKRARFEVFKRDRFTCQYCGRTPPDVVLEIDHVIPVGSGGTNDRVNLVTACFDCNRGKSARALSEVSASVSAAQQVEIERRQQTESLNRWLMKCRKQDDAAVLRIAGYWGDVMYPDEPGQWALSDHRHQSIRTFLKRLPEAEIFDAIDGTATRDHLQGQARFKYFCGICWSKIKERGNG